MTDLSDSERVLLFVWCINNGKVPENYKDDWIAVFADITNVPISDAYAAFMEARALGKITFLPTNPNDNPDVKM